MGRGDAVTGAVLGRVPVQEKERVGGGMDGGGPGDNDHNDDQLNNWASSSPLSGGGGGRRVRPLRNKPDQFQL
jgi:hypothetical protein